MSEISRATIESLLAPLLAAQLFVIVFVYFSIVRARLSASYKPYLVFLGGFIFFLVAQPVQRFSPHPISDWLLYIRMGSLFSVSIPALLLASFLRAGFRNSKGLVCWIWGAGILVSLSYVFLADAAMQQLLIERKSLEWLPFEVAVRQAHKVQIIGAAVMLVFPTLYLLLKEIGRERDVKQLAFLFGAFSFGVFVVVFSLRPETIGLFYVASIFSAWCWSWAVFTDVREMKGRAALLKDELQQRVQAGAHGSGLDVGGLLAELEQLSDGNLAVYKMRLREILNRLTDATIEAGGDAAMLVERNARLGLDIDAGADATVARDIVQAEAEELSGMIAELPGRGNNGAVERARKFIAEEYGRDLGMDEVAEAVGVSKAHLMREFKKETGETMNRFLTAVRIDKAKVELKTKTVTDTAFDVGFNDPNYFSTVFKKQTGKTPGAYKKALEESSGT